MKLSDFLSVENCCMELKASTRDEAIVELAALLEKQGRISNREEFTRKIFERERLGSTGIGNHVAIPHAPTDTVQGLAVAFGRSAHGLDFRSLDGQEVNFVFLIGTNPADLNVYLKVLASLSRLVNDRIFREEFKLASTAQDAVAVIRKYEKERREAGVTS